MVLRYTGAVEETGSGAVNYAQQIQQLFEDLVTTAKGICGSSWVGAAPEAFERAQHAWNAEAAGLNDAHTKIGQLTQQASQNAFNADLRGSQLFG